MENNFTLIIANKFDYCIDSIIKWLKYHKLNYLVIDPDKKVQINKIKLNNQYIDIELNIKGKHVALDQIRSVIFWKGRIEFELPAIQKEELVKNMVIALDKFLKRELNTITQYIYNELNKKRIFGLCITKNPNKLILLSKAREVGLKIPNTLISSSDKIIKSELLQQELITKPIQEIFNFRSKKEIHTSFTHFIDVEYTNENKDLIFPSLIQEKIEKKYELRIFYFNKEFHSMAIFSQTDDKTRTDFRDYNYEKPNRMVPYTLPNEIKKKLKKLINVIDYHSCSFDMIVNMKNEYVFLEVNPLGQFDLESVTCNFKIEKKIVEYLKS